MLPDPIKKFIEIFSDLPGIGVRQATRLAFKLINSGKAKIDETAKAIEDLKYLKICSQCFFVFSPPAGGQAAGLCQICSDKNRKQNVIAIVEKETDLISLERTQKFKGRYLVLGEITKTGVLDSVQKLRLNHLKNFIKKNFANPSLVENKSVQSDDRRTGHFSTIEGIAEEIIIAINPTTYGDLNASIIEKELTPFAKKISRLGRGIPTGGEIEFADDETLGSAIERRN